MAEIVFWFSIFFIFYVYIGYPLLLMALSTYRNRPVKKENLILPASFIITAYNEEEWIQEKIENTLKQDYPKGKLEIIVVSDCSTDQTDEIVKSYKSYGVLHIRASSRRGKEAAQKLAVDVATGEILVFSDVATNLRSDGVSSIIKNFYDPTIGCVSSVDKFTDPDGKISGEGAYVRYEMMLRILETQVSTLVSLSGSFFAARREICQDWAIDLQSDFNTLLNSVKMGLRGVLDPESIGYYKNVLDEKKEFERKVRTVLRGISVFRKNFPMLNPLRYGFFSWQLISHKLCRWLIPFTMLSAMISNLLLMSYGSFYYYLFILQLIFYVFSVLGIVTSFMSSGKYWGLPSYLVMVNLSILTAWYRYFRGDCLTFWEPSKR